MRRAAAALLLIALSCSPTAEDTKRLSPVASPATFNDLVYVWTASGLRIVTMPGGEIFRDLGFGMPSAETGVPTDATFLHVTNPDAESRWRTSIERVDLATGSTTLRIDAGAVQRPGWATGWPVSSIRSYGTVVTVPALPSQLRWAAGSQVLLVRGQVNGHPGIRVDRFDARTGAHLGTKRFAPLEAHGPVSLHALDGEGHRYLLVRARVSEQRLVRGEWTLLSGELSEMATISSEQIGFDLAMCSAQLLPLAKRGELVTQCFEKTADSGGRLRFLDARNLELIGSVELPRAIRVGQIDYVGSLGGVSAWIPSDDMLTLLVDFMEMPVVIRVDPRTHSLLDARRVSERASLPSLELFPVQIALGKTLIMPRVQVSPDGRLFYYVGFDRANDVRIIDAAAATLVAKVKVAGEVHAIHLSNDALRLYVLHGSRQAMLTVLDARTGTTFSETPLSGEAQAILAAVASRR